MKNLTKKAVEGLTCLILTIGVAQAASLRGPNAHFDTDKDKVINEQTMADFAHSIKSNVVDLRIYCFTDTRGSFEYNRKLATKRCNAVSSLLAQSGIIANPHIVVGEEGPEVGEEGKDKAGRQGVNRRVEIYYELRQEAVVLDSGKFKRNRLTLLGGYAPSGIDSPRETNPNEFIIDEDWDIELGLGYSYRITRSFNAGVVLFTNKSGFLQLGLDF